MTKDLVHGVGHSPVCQILLQIVVRAVITFSPPAWTSFVEIKINGQKVESVTSFKYLGSVVTDEGSKPEILTE